MFFLRSYLRSSRSIAIQCLFAKELNLKCSFASYSGILLRDSYDQFQNEKCNKLFLTTKGFYSTSKAFLSDDKIDKEPEKAVKKSYKAQLKQVIKDYGATVIVFHVAISLASFGICYLAVSNGLDVPRFVSFLGFSDTSISNTFVIGSSTVFISYALHKLFAPVRIGITLTATPFIVRYLRRIGVLKMKNVPKP